MADKPIDQEAVQRIKAKLDGVLEEYPELREPNPERQQALSFPHPAGGQTPSHPDEPGGDEAEE